MDDTLLKIFIAVTTIAVAVQAGILVALYVAVRKSTERMEALATEVKSKVLPTVETAQSMLVELRPKIEVMSTNFAESSDMLRTQLGRLDATVTDALDRARLQVIRADELLNRTMDRVEETSEVVHKTVISPLRQVNGLMTAISTAREPSSSPVHDATFHLRLPIPIARLKTVTTSMRISSGHDMAGFGVAGSRPAIVAARSLCGTCPSRPRANGPLPPAVWMGTPTKSRGCCPRPTARR